MNSPFRSFFARISRGLHLAMVQTFLFLGLLLLTQGICFAAMGGLPGPEDQLDEFDPASDTEENQCLFGPPTSLTDLNEFYGVSEQIIVGRRDPTGTTCALGACRLVNSGEFIVARTGWITNQPGGIPGLPEVYPTGYTSTMSPRDDFRSKVDKVKFVMDFGTAHEKIYIFPARKIMFGDEELVSDTLPQIIVGGVLVPNPLGPLAATSFLPRLHPENVGCHQMEIYLIMNARHCDGLVADPNTCLQPGENFNGRQFFEVQPGAAQSQ